MKNLENVEMHICEIWIIILGLKQIVVKEAFTCIIQFNISSCFLNFDKHHKNTQKCSRLKHKSLKNHTLHHPQV